MGLAATPAYAASGDCTTSGATVTCTYTYTGAAQTWIVPAGVAGSIVAKLNVDIAAAIKSPELRARLSAEGGDVVGNSSEEFARFIRNDIATWAKVAKATGLRAE